MWRTYTIQYWQQDPRINDCYGNSEHWTGKARSLDEAITRAKNSKNRVLIWFRLGKLSVNRAIVDPIPDAHGHFTIRPYDGTPNGDINAQPLATAYDKEVAQALVDAYNSVNVSDSVKQAHNSFVL